MAQDNENMATSLPPLPSPVWAPFGPMPVNRHAPSKLGSTVNRRALNNLGSTVNRHVRNKLGSTGAYIYIYFFSVIIILGHIFIMLGNIFKYSGQLVLYSSYNFP